MIDNIVLKDGHKPPIVLCNILLCKKCLERFVVIMWIVQTLVLWNHETKHQNGQEWWFITFMYVSFYIDLVPRGF